MEEYDSLDMDRRAFLKGCANLYFGVIEIDLEWLDAGKVFCKHEKEDLATNEED